MLPSVVATRPRRALRGGAGSLPGWHLWPLLLGLVAGCGDAAGPPVTQNPATSRPSLDPTYRASGRMAAGDVSVHLFEWKWPDIAAECEAVLGPAGYAAVQVSPPQEHSVEPSHTWSQRYQPVSYSIDRSRSGSRAEFSDMVSRCRAVGVGIYVDAVINHMTNYPSPGTGSNGTAYTKYHYPGLYVQTDFHPPCAITDYQSAANVQDCELFSLPDLHTGLASVRRKIADYLLMLARLGVAGFRIDAAKHIQQVELDSIVGLVNRTLTAEAKPLPYFFLEVVGGSGEALGPRDYFGVGYSSGGAADITEFTFTGVQDKFRKAGGQHISQLDPNGPPGGQFSAAAWGMMPADKAVVFLQNHDTQHQGSIGYRDGDVFRLANVWLLAQPYGYPSVLSSYAFTDNVSGPPSDAAGNTTSVGCAPRMETAAVGQWVCEHRDPAIAGMVRFRRVVAGTGIAGWWSNGAHAIAFSRGDRGFVAINRETSRVTATIATPLAAGEYCDVLTGGVQNGVCAGRRVVIGATGTAAVDLAPNTAIAIHVGAKL